MEKYKIIVRGGYGLTNFGDDALLKSIHNDYLYGYSEKELAYSSTYAKYLNNDIGDYETMSLNVNYNELTKILIYGGGTQFYAFNRKKSLLKKIISNFHLLFNPKQLSKAIKVKLESKGFNGVSSDNKSHIKMALGVGVGPFLEGADPNIEQRTKALFKKMNFVAVRDKYSFQKCKEWGVQNFNMYADLCFKMKHEKFFPEKLEQTLNKVGVIVRDWDKTKEGNSYGENLMETVRLLRKEGKDVHFIVFAKDKDPHWLKTLKREQEELLLWDPDIFSIDEFFTKLSSFDLFITARYHGAVFSAMLGKPFITIGVEQKLSMISAIFCNGSYNWSYPFEVKDLMKNIKQIDSNYNKHSSNIVQEALIQKKLAVKMKDDLELSIKKYLS